MPCALDGVRRHEHDLTHRTRPHIIAMHSAKGAFHHLSPIYARVVFSLAPGPPSSNAYPPSSDAGSASCLAPTMRSHRGDDTREPLPSASSDVEMPDLDGLSDANIVDALAELIEEEPQLTSSVAAKALASSSTAQYFHSPVQVPSASSNAPAQFASSSAVQYFNSPVQIPNESSNHLAEDVSLQFSKSLQEAFVSHVMCDFTPRSPCALPMRKWASVDRLLRHLQPHVPAEVFAQLTPDKLKHLITEWFHVHPAYAGLSFYEWCKQLKDRSDPLARPRSSAVHFPFEYTPR